MGSKLRDTRRSGKRRRQGAADWFLIARGIRVIHHRMRAGLLRVLPEMLPGEFTRVYSAALRGADAVEVELEVNETSPSNSGGEMQAVTVIVGLPHTAVLESRDRVWIAIANSALPGTLGGRTTVNLVLPSFDLPMALAMMANRADGFDRSVFDRCTIVGELALDGGVRTVKGILSVADLQPTAGGLKGAGLRQVTPVVERK